MFRRAGIVPLFARVVAAGALVASSAWPAPVVAQDDAQRARERFDTGVRLFEQERYTDALDAFRDAHRIRPHPSVLVNIANCYMNLDRPLQAAEYFERYLRKSEEDTDPERRAEVERALGRARVELATIRIEAPTDTQVFVDGDLAGRTPLAKPVEVNPGPHVVELRHADGEVETARVELEKGAQATVTAELGAGTTAATGAGTTAATGAGTEAATGAETATGTETATATETGTEPQGDRDILGLPLGTWIAGGVSVVALVAAVGFGAKAVKQKNTFDALAEDIRSRPSDDPELQRLRSDLRAIDDARRINAITADVLLGVGIVAAGVAVYFALTDEDPAESQQLQAGPTALPGGGGAWLRARF